jgi:hypothetical protein
MQIIAFSTFSVSSALRHTSLVRYAIDTKDMDIFGEFQQNISFKDTLAYFPKMEICYEINILSMSVCLSVSSINF